MQNAIQAFQTITSNINISQAKMWDKEVLG